MVDFDDWETDFAISGNRRVQQQVRQVVELRRSGKPIGISHNSEGRFLAEESFIVEHGRKPNKQELRDYHKRNTHGHKYSISSRNQELRQRHEMDTYNQCAETPNFYVQFSADRDSLEKGRLKEMLCRLFDPVVN